MLAAASALILLLHLLLLAGVLVSRLRDLLAPLFREGSGGGQAVSVIVAAKDEQEALPTLLASLESQSIQEFEIVLVDDRSTDGTPQIMEEFKSRHGDRVRVLHLRKDPGSMNPKQIALDAAVQASAGEILFFSDADCTLPRAWLQTLLPYFQDPRVGVVFGQVSLRKPTSFLERYQAFELPLIHQYSSGGAGMGVPTGCFGNNLCARRLVLGQLGGFQGLGYTLTEDAALVSAAAKKRWKVRVCTHLRAMIRTQPAASWRSFIHQHVRWNSGAFYSRDPATALSYRFVTLYLIASVLALPLTPLFPPLAMLPATSFISIGLLGLISVLLYSRDRVRALLRLTPYTLFFMVFYAWITLLSIFNLPPRWKGRKLKSR